MGQGLSRSGRHASALLPISGIAYLFTVSGILSLSLTVSAAPQYAPLISAKPVATRPELNNTLPEHPATSVSEPNHSHAETDSGDSNDSGEFSGLMTAPKIRPSHTTLSHHTTTQLPLDSLLDSQGQILQVPSQTQADFSYAPPATPELTPSKTPRSKKSPKAKKSRDAKTANTKKTAERSKTQGNASKQLLTRRENVANDANCRWLDNRMTQLESQLPKNTDHKNAHQQAELSARWQEWQCLQCDSQVAANIDRSRCQYRR